MFNPWIKDPFITEEDEEILINLVSKYGYGYLHALLAAYESEK